MEGEDGIRGESSFWSLDCIQGEAEKIKDKEMIWEKKKKKEMIWGCESMADRPGGAWKGHCSNLLFRKMTCLCYSS